MNGRARRARIAGLGILALIATAPVALALQSAGADSASREAKLGTKVMCMCGTCNMAAANCNHPGSSFSGPCDVARGELAQIRDRVARGDSADLILQSFVQEYGPLVLIEPPHSGFDWTVWIVPAAVPLLALLAVWIVLRRWRGRAAPAVAQGPGVSPELLARVRHAAEDDGRA
ncbi:MAG TPA: cytochrome c-type biogenesis protein CcmH [Candidatus Acidoferrales bacterium]|nr:cytochrome c-type biogenesis protein CcmH [Candidatus Acidoferrales bacterium]